MPETDPPVRRSDVDVDQFLMRLGLTHDTPLDEVADELLRLRELLGECHPKVASEGLKDDIAHVLGWVEDWRCECGDLNRHHEAFCYRCGAGQQEDDDA